MASHKQMLGGCCVCLDERGWKENPLVYCDGRACDVAVHKNCYGITKVPSGPWYCQKCASKEAGDHLRCCLCPKLEGVLKKTDDNRWVHVLCALYIPEIRFGNVTTMEPIIVSGIPVSSFNSKNCYICEENESTDKQYGVCLGCFKPSCKTIFHVTCGQSRGLLGEEEGSVPDSVQYCGYCPLHAKKTGTKFSKNCSSNSPNKPNEPADSSNSGCSEDKKDMSTPLSVEVSSAAEKPKPRSRSRPQTGAAKPKRTRKPAAKKSAAAVALAKLSPQLKSPLRSPPIRSPSMRSPISLLSPGIANKSPISLVPATSTQELLEQQFELSKKMLENQAPLDIAQLLSCITMIQHENQQLEAEVQHLTQRRDHLVSVNARLALPLNAAASAPSMAPSMAATGAAGVSASNATSALPSIPSILSNGPTFAMNHSLSTSHSQAPRLMTSHQAPVSTSQSVVKQFAPAIDMTGTATSKDASNKKSNTQSNNSREGGVTQSRKRSTDSVIKTNVKQMKQSSTPPTVIKSSSRPPSHQQKVPEAVSHFPWPSPLPQNSLPTTPSTSSPMPHDSAFSTQSVSSRLPPINALSQTRSAPQLSAAPTSYPYNAAAASLASYPNNTAAVAALAGYASYPQFSMFPMGGATLSDMASLNPSALTGLAMQGLHNSQQYYRKAADITAAAAQKAKPGSGVQ